MTLSDLVREINALSGQLQEAEAVHGKSALDLTGKATSGTCALLRRFVDSQDPEFQANLDQVVNAIRAVSPEDMARFQLDDEWGRIAAALGDAARAVGLSEQSVVLVLQALNAARPPAKPTVKDLRDELARCRDLICTQADFFAGDISGVTSAIQHERASRQRRRVRGALAAAGLVGVGLVTAPVLGPVSAAIVLAGLGAGVVEGIRAVAGEGNAPEDLVQISATEFIIGTQHLPRHRA